MEGMDAGMVGMDQMDMDQMQYQQQVQMQQQYGGMEMQMQMDNQQKNYFDSIETDEFVMPNKFEVEIRMQDNSVSFIFLLILNDFRLKELPLRFKSKKEESLTSVVSETTELVLLITTPLPRLTSKLTITLINASVWFKLTNTKLSQQ